MLPVLRQLLNRPGAFIDVGANVGQTLIKVLSVDPHRQYVGFEPQPDCCFYIQQFLRDNGLANAQIVPVALSSANGLFPLYFDNPSDDMASLLPVHIQRSSRSHVSWCQARIGDEALRELSVGEIAAIKIDVEGLELEVLRGLSSTLRHRPPILFEVLNNYSWGALVDEQRRTENSARAREIFALMSGAGYAIFKLDRTGRPHALNTFDLDSPPSPEFGEGRDYLAQPSE
jgi:FkbM family methyltransferase